MTKTPAEAGFHMPAEWEKHEGTWLQWPHHGTYGLDEGNRHRGAGNKEWKGADLSAGHVDLQGRTPHGRGPSPRCHLAG
jgi:hypothetical protein